RFPRWTFALIDDHADSFWKFDGKLYFTQTAPVRHRAIGCGVDCIPDVPLYRRSGIADGWPGYDTGRAGRAARAVGFERSDSGAVPAFRQTRGIGRFRDFLPDGPARRSTAAGTAARDIGTEHRRHGHCLPDRRSDGRLYGPLSEALAQPGLSRRFAHRDLLAHFLHRDHADSHLRCRTRLAFDLRARSDGSAGLVVDGLADRVWMEIDHHACVYAGSLSDDVHHAAYPIRDDG